MNNSKKIAIVSLTSTFSIILASIANFQIPFFIFFKPDFSDIPIFVLTFMLGGKYGIISLFVVSIVRMLTGDAVLPATFMLRISSSIVIFFINYYKKYQKNFCFLAIIAIICNIIIRAPISYYLWVFNYNIPREIFVNQMWPSIILLTVLRLSCNILISKLIFKYFGEKLVIR
ncbi:MAG: hypothetical protein J6P21_00430 [Clostridia bacterium]|nr:hypothetical protein [Clostridia bacterium]